VPDQRLRVAVIEDDAAMRAVFAEILGDEGYEVFAYDRADGAHRLVRQVLPSVVLLDLRLGSQGADGGWQIIDELVLDPATRDLPVVIVSADRSLEWRSVAISSRHGLWALRKPFDLAELLTIVGQAAASHPHSTTDEGWIHA
jgi:CheY-like chemotaxis protein